MEIYEVRLLAYYIGAEKLIKKPEDVVQPEGEGDNEDTVS